MSTASSLLTADEFWNLPGDGKYRELVRGEMVEHMPPGARHGIVQLDLGARLRQWAKSTQAGVVGVESGFRLAENPDTVRGPDIAFVRQDRIPATGVPRAYWNLHPDLAIEVISPDETAADVQAKLEEYLESGTSLVWLVYPNTRSVVVHARDGTARTLRGDALLHDADLLPGFSCRVAELFE